MVLPEESGVCFLKQVFITVHRHSVFTVSVCSELTTRNQVLVNQWNCLQDSQHAMADIRIAHISLSLRTFPPVCGDSRLVYIVSGAVRHGTAPCVDASYRRAVPCGVIRRQIRWERTFIASLHRPLITRRSTRVVSGIVWIGYKTPIMPANDTTFMIPLLLCIVSNVRYRPIIDETVCRSPITISVISGD